jgi:hypothetical protein
VRVTVTRFTTLDIVGTGRRPAGARRVADDAGVTDPEGRPSA